MTLRTIWLALGCVWIATLFYLSLTPHPPEPFSFAGADKVEHAAAYCSLMLWFCQLHIRRIVLATVLIATGVGIEIAQGLTGYRYFEYADMLANSAGVLIGWVFARTRLGQILALLETHAKS